MPTLAPLSDYSPRGFCFCSVFAAVGAGFPAASWFRGALPFFSAAVAMEVDEVDYSEVPLEQGSIWRPCLQHRKVSTAKSSLVI